MLVNVGMTSSVYEDYEVSSYSCKAILLISIILLLYEQSGKEKYTEWIRMVYSHRCQLNSMLKSFLSSTRIEFRARCCHHHRVLAPL